MGREPRAEPLTCVEISHDEGVATITLSRGKVNALNPDLVNELDRLLDKVETDDSIRALILTGRGSFFSFGFDIPEFASYSRDLFTQFLVGFTDLYERIYMFPKPIVASLNGHAIAGGYMLALACDRRVMVTGRARIALNEITFGAAVPAGCAEMLRACVGQRDAEVVLLGGDMLDSQAALDLGLVDGTASPESLDQTAAQEARTLAAKDQVAFRSIKTLLRGPVAENMRRIETDSIDRFVDIWYSKATQDKLRKIEIRQ